MHDLRKEISARGDQWRGSRWQEKKKNKKIEMQGCRRKSFLEVTNNY